MAHKQLHLVAAKPKVDLWVDMGDGPATPTGGFAGWEQVPRVRRRALTAFNGLPAFQQDVPIHLDGFRENRSIERQLEQIESLGGNVKFRAYGPIYRSGSVFVFGDEPEYAEQVRAADETLIRVRMVLKLMGFVKPDVAGERPEPRVAVDDAVPLVYTTKAGDTLSRIAFELYHDASRGKEIGKLNGVTDVHRKLPAGRELKLR